MLEKILFTAACLVIPVIWGVVVNWMFVSWKRRDRRLSKPRDETVFPDYQI